MSNKILILALICLLLPNFVSCSKDSDEKPAPTPPEEEEKKSDLPLVTYITSVTGIGDLSYNDNIANGIFQFGMSDGMTTQLWTPRTNEEADSMYRHWLSLYSETDSAILILGSSVYTKFVTEDEAGSDSLISTPRRVLLVESYSPEMPKGVSGIFINRYGVSYLAGAMTSKMPLYAIAAMWGDPIVSPAMEGVEQGFRDYAENPDENMIIDYLSEDEIGYASPDFVYGYLTYTTEFFPRRLIFPMLGGSISGMLRYIDEKNWEDQAFCVDVDRSYLNNNICGCIEISVGELIYDYMRKWQEGGSWKKFGVYGMNTDYVRLTINEDDSYDSITHQLYFGDYLSNLYDLYYDKAVAAELNYPLFDK